MYLEARRFLWIDGDGKGPDAEIGERLREAVPQLTGMLRPTKVIAEVVYWRKANAIHAWFVKNVQDGTDDCNSYYVSREDLDQLAATCDQVLRDPSLAEALLPTQGGFFFGSTKYDDGYREDLAHTHSRLTELLGRTDLAGWVFYYRSNW
jgi:hypothetical protein